MSGGGWASSYHRMSDDSVSSYAGHPTYDAALREALQNLKSHDINHTWVRDPQDEVVWDSASNPRICLWCGQLAAYLIDMKVLEVAAPAAVCADCLAKPIEQLFRLHPRSTVEIRTI